MRSINKQIIEINKKIVKEYKPEKIILFGSYAWGKPTKDSDVDLFIIKKTTTPGMKRIEQLDKIFLRREVALDFLVYTPTQIKENLKNGDIFINKILSEGIVCYEKAK